MVSSHRHSNQSKMASNIARWSFAQTIVGIFMLDIYTSLWNWPLGSLDSATFRTSGGILGGYSMASGHFSHNSRFWVACLAPTWPFRGQSDVIFKDFSAQIFTVSIQTVWLSDTVSAGFNKFGFNKSSRFNESVLDSKKIFYSIKTSDLANFRV